MDNEQKFWVTCWSLVAACFIALTAAILASNLGQLAALQHSRDPIALSCALGGQRSEAACLAVVAGKQ